MGSDISFALDDDDRPFFAAYDRSAPGLWTGYCTDRDCNQPSATLDADRDADQHALTLTQEGFPMLVFNVRSAGSASQFALRMTCLDQACNDADSAPVGTPVGPYGPFDIVTREDGNPAYLYQSLESGTTLLLAICDNPACTTTDTTSYAADEAASSLSLTIAEDGRPVAAYTAGDELHYLICDQPACTELQPIENPDLFGPLLESSRKPSFGNGSNVPEPALEGVALSILPDGTPLFAYHDVEVGLMVAHCDTLTCDTPPSPVRIGKRDVRSGADIAIGPDGVPVIAFIQRDDFNVQRPHIVRCEQCPDW